MTILAAITSCLLSRRTTAFDRAEGPAHAAERRASRLRIVGSSLLALFLLTGCEGSTAIAALTYECGNNGLPAHAAPGVCGAGDDRLPPEPTYPTDVCQTLVADKSTPDEAHQDTERVQAALAACKGGAVKLVADGRNNAFITGHLNLDSVTLWVDAGVTLYASRNATVYQKTGNCGLPDINDSGACVDYITVSGASPAIMGDGTIDGQGGEPLVGHDYSWWQLSAALRGVDGSIGNPNLINLAKGTTGFVLYRITLHNSPKFHVKLTSSPPGGVCNHVGDGFIVWGITILTPSKLMNSQGFLLTPHNARNTDGVDPGTTDIATCGVIACNTISTGDDQIAIKGGHWVSNLLIAHNHFGTGHGMSIGSETYGATSVAGEIHRGVEDVEVYDLTIDGDSREVGYGSSDADSNGIRVKSDESRGGVVNNIRYHDICMRDQANTLLVSGAYNPLFSGVSYPNFGALEFRNIRHVTCMGTLQPVVTFNGFGPARPAGPITLDNVVIDNAGPPSVSAAFSSIVLGPRDSNIRPFGTGVTVTDSITEPSSPISCSFPILPTPDRPAGWLR